MRRSKGTLMRVSAVRVPRHRERCDSAIHSRGLTLDDCIRYDYTDRATLCHPFTTPTQPRYEDHANQNRSFAFFLFFQNRPSPFCPYLCYRFNHHRHAFSLFFFLVDHRFYEKFYSFISLSPLPL